MQLALPSRLCPHPSLVLFSPLFWAGLRSMSAVWTAPCVGTLLSSAMATGPSSRVLFCCIDSMGFLRKCAGEGVNAGVHLTGLWTLALPFQFCGFWRGTRLFSLLWKWGCWWPPPPPHRCVVSMKQRHMHQAQGHSRPRGTSPPSTHPPSRLSCQ